MASRRPRKSAVIGLDTDMSLVCTGLRTSSERVWIQREAQGRTRKQGMRLVHKIEEPISNMRRNNKMFEFSKHLKNSVVMSQGKAILHMGV
jgi:hypothetical protein